MNSSAIRTLGPHEVVTQEVIIVRFLHGKGVAGDPCRCITQIWSMKGDLLAQDDPSTYAKNAP